MQSQQQGAPTTLQETLDALARQEAKAGRGSELRQDLTFDDLVQGLYGREGIDQAKARELEKEIESLDGAPSPLIQDEDRLRAEELKQVSSGMNRQ